MDARLTIRRFIEMGRQPEQETQPELEPEPEPEPELVSEQENEPEPEAQAVGIFESWLARQPATNAKEEEHEGLRWRLQSDAYQRDTTNDGWERFRARQRLAAAQALTAHTKLQIWSKCVVSSHENWLQYLHERETRETRRTMALQTCLLKQQQLGALVPHVSA